MFLSKKQKELVKEIMRDGLSNIDDRNPTINIDIQSNEQLFSPYCCADTKLNPELGKYLYDRCADNPFADKVTVNIHTDNIDGDTVRQSIINYVKDSYRDAVKSIKRNTFISITMTAMGIAFLAVLFALNYFFDNVYVNTVLEIAAWVFIWEAVDCFFLERPKIKARCIVLLKLYTAEINIIDTPRQSTEK